MPPRSNSTPLQPEGSIISVPNELAKLESNSFKADVLVRDDLACDLGVPRTSSMSDTTSLVATSKVRESFQRRFMSNFMRQSSADDVIKSNLKVNIKSNVSSPASALTKLRSSTNEKSSSAPIMYKQQSIDSLQEESESMFKQLVYLYKQNNTTKTTLTSPPKTDTTVISVPTIVVNEFLDDNKPTEESDIIK